MYWIWTKKVPTSPAPTPLARLGYLPLYCHAEIDVVARLGLYLVSKPEPAFMPILKSLFTAATIPDTLIVILLDWRKPWDWMRQLRTWVRLLGVLFRSLDDDARRALDDVTQICTSLVHSWEGTCFCSMRRSPGRGLGR